MNKLLRGVVLSVVLGVAVYAAIAAASRDFTKVNAYLLHFSGPLLCAGIGLATMNYLFRFAKWQYYLRLLEVPIPAWSSLGIFLSGFSLTVTPGKVGEVLKSYLIKQAYGTPIARTAPIVIAERLTDLFALLLLGLLGVAEWMGPAERPLMVAGFGLCGGFLLVVTSRRVAYWAIDLLGKLPPRRFFGRLVPRLREFYDATALLIGPRALLVCTFYSILAWSCECVAFYVILLGFPQVKAPLLLCTFIYSMMTVAGALAFIPGGLGVTEGGMALLLCKLAKGADQSVAVAATLIIRVITLWFAVALGVVALVLWQRLKHVAVDMDKLRTERA